MWKIRNAATESKTWQPVYYKFRKMNRALEQFSRMRLVPALSARAIILGKKEYAKRQALMTEAMVDLPFFVIKFE
jgi:hypothetical protein